MSVSKKIVIVGGVAGGMSAATRLRRLDENAQIIVLERTGYVSFANCGLPYHLSGVIEDRSSLLLQNPSSLAARFNIDARIKSEVIDIEPFAKKVTVTDLVQGNTYELEYDFLILSPGASALEPSIEGAERVMTMRDVEDMDRAIAWLGSKPETALVLGGGFIGIELAENLLKRGLKVTLLQRSSQLMKNLDPEMVGVLATRMRSSGVDIKFNTTLSALTKKTATLSTGEVVSADLVFSAMGVKPDVTLAVAAGLRLGESGGIWVDEFQRTSDPHIYAVGDAVEKHDAIDGGATLTTLAGLANRHGQAVANAICGAETHPATPSLGTSIVSFETLTAASTGWTETALKQANRPVRVIHSHPANHAAYYPGAETMRLKLLVDPDTDLILGAQGVGGSGVDKRIDVIATSIFAGITASKLSQLELAYDPQHGSAKDPINMLGYINRNIIEGLTPTVQWHELDELMNDGAILIDVRTAGEHKFGHIPGSANFPVDELREHIQDIEHNKVIVYCQVGQRGHIATRLLRQHGFNAVNLDGGYLTWKAGKSSQEETK